MTGRLENLLMKTRRSRKNLWVVPGRSKENLWTKRRCPSGNLKETNQWYRCRRREGTLKRQIHGTGCPHREGFLKRQATSTKCAGTDHANHNNHRPTWSKGGKCASERFNVAPNMSVNNSNWAKHSVPVRGTKKILYEAAKTELKMYRWVQTVTKMYKAVKPVPKIYEAVMPAPKMNRVVMPGLKMYNGAIPVLKMYNEAVPESKMYNGAVPESKTYNGVAPMPKLNNMVLQHDAQCAGRKSYENPMRNEANHPITQDKETPEKEVKISSARASRSKGGDPDVNPRLRSWDWGISI